MAGVLKWLKFPEESGFSTSGMADKKWYWIPVKDQFVAAEVLNETKTDVKARLGTGEEVNVKATACYPMNPPKFDGAEDCSELGHLNEPSVFHNLKRRYDKDLIYTYSGLFLVVCNPYKVLPIYQQEVVDFYRGKKRAEAPPHIYATSDLAYRMMINERQNQSLLITGESGAGKTENTKKVIQYITHVAGRSGEGLLEKQLIELNPMLEAFGNAKTIRNNNSSRFGKFIKLQFNSGGLISGAELESYLLEKSRVITRASTERSYHIFYQLLAGASPTERTNYKIQGAERYKYLSCSGCYTVNRMDDVQEFKHTREAMGLCEITDEEQALIYRLVMAILYLGNVEFAKGGVGEGGEIRDKDPLRAAAELLDVDPSQLDDGLCKPRIKAGNEYVKTHLTPEKAAHSRDALSKALYGRLFLWIVRRSNKVLAQEKCSSFIGVLDISGFEIFKLNSFEQLCINYTNEKLQQFFNNHMFKLEQEEYMREKINWTFIDFGLDAQATIDLIDKKPNGILPILDEESLFPKATDASFVQKLHDLHEHNPMYERPRFSKTSFVLSHYAGKVEYETADWLEKNKDPLQEDLQLCLKASKQFFFGDLFSDDLLPKVVRAPSPALAAARSAPQDSAARKKGAIFITVAFAHKEQLTSLMNTLTVTNPHFVRCIIPNHLQRPGELQQDVVLDQLRCNGVLEGIRISRKGFPNRVVYAEFLKRYYLLAPNIPRNPPDAKGAVQQLIDYLKVDPEQVRFGLTKIFFRTGELAKIEERREKKIAELMVSIQAACRGWLCRNLYRKLTQQTTAAKILQRNLRAYLDLKSWMWLKAFIKVRPLLKRRNLEDELSEKEKAVKELSDKIKAEHDARKSAESQLETLKRDFENIRSQLEAEKEALDDLALQKQRIEAQKTDLERRVQALETDLNEESSANTDLALLKKRLDEKAKELEEALEEEQKARTQLDAIKKQQDSIIAELKEKNERNDDTIAKLDRNKQTLEKEVGELKELLEDEGETIAQLEKAKRSLQGDLEETKEKLEDLNKQSSNLDKAKKKLESDLKDLQGQLSEQSGARGNAEGTVKKLTDELNSLKKDMEELSSGSSNLASAKKKLENDLQAIHDELEEEKARASNLDKAKKKLEVDLEEANEKYEEEHEAKAALEDLKRKNEFEIADLKRQLAEALEKIARLEKEKAALAQEVASLKQQLADEQKDKAEIDKARKKLGSELDALRQSLENESKDKGSLDKARKADGRPRGAQVPAGRRACPEGKRREDHQEARG